MFRMINPVREYAWGSTTAFSELFGWAASATPRAEIWMGAHPGDPSSLELHDGSAGGAAEVVELPDYLEQTGETPGSFPFLLKVLAAEQPLSIQSHPTQERAQSGFAAEEAAGLARDSPLRSYKDPNSKPELIVALTEFSALCGFRPYAETAAELSELADAVAQARVTPAGVTPAGVRTGESDGAEHLSRLLEQLLRHVLAEDYTSALELLVRSGREQASSAAGEFSALLEADELPGFRARSEALEMLQQVSAAFPQDPGIFVTLLLNRLTLQPGESIYLPAGNLHAYLHGVGVEIMANSDNVLRGGLTSKHLDVDELLSVTDCEVLPVPHCPVEKTDTQLRTEGTPRRTRYQAPFEEFQLELLEFPGEITLDHPGHGIVLCTSGVLAVDSPDSETPRMLTLAPGESAFLPHTSGHRLFSAAHAQAFVATTTILSPDQEHPRP